MEAMNQPSAYRANRFEYKFQAEPYKLLLSGSLEDAMELAIQEYHSNPQNATLVLVVR